MKVNTYNIKGEKAETTELPEGIFGAAWKPALVKQVFDGEMANKRRPWAHTKTRGEVRGGGRKPWRQKGTGRARHGSTRSPLWVGGGIAHGPRNERDYSVKINKKMRRGALFSLLSRKLKDKEIILIDNFEMAKSKTREAFNIFKNLRTTGDIYNLGIKGGKALLALAKGDAKRAVHNLPFVNFIEPRNLNVSALLQNKYLILDKASIKELEKTYAR
ncbi:50S ribosomal protein L4 [Candidatus Giovannonibacteria bacterium RIFCSPLOWO2_01_FULL_43_160]|uniref:Large ribosomal subunit protein uL4 n=2 Tax=Candidatus Giovannoniibacteriota TaxID=1752738 RepID=A0A0G1L4N4_9BACT|nr:MAG: 50S ribosomal protein L4 [Candidatus Giovannonibacteria bacterium GW2011_GWB1_43_13]KKS99846.1 MAG: 50S ribosomal protein L4 [Candidatus Giovannonibacteria bacterium GW2011_GWA1_43_15]KKT63547.1 MAG: 50S ribosomal protein L4 [Candidatus Giovannonibacteria bacterium GW2011_GWA2_44_26]OGF58578.1 MAG: 50S ribosomal protein L4 [Candidatus Giovannonibacteria bacterium RIFCSPHIGHO2_01_FULL_43_140]OGF69970.1 MAG: 50S ribosomal protein L4 [Candidatus Giovannonibacteria bacterium RIFCSPHIGHO2_02